MNGLQDLDWIAVDWGTTNLRVWAMDAASRVLGNGGSAEGMGTLDRAGFEPALMRLIGGWLPAEGRVPVVACGMVGSRQGWVEAPYRPVPCVPLAKGQMARPDTRDTRLAVQVVPGLKQDHPADVMRGEETQLWGAGLPAGSCCVLPGTHSKWAWLGDDERVPAEATTRGQWRVAVAAGLTDRAL